MNLKLPLVALLVSASSLLFACDSETVTAVDNGNPDVVSIDDYTQPGQLTSYEPAAPVSEYPEPTAYHRGTGANMTNLSGRVVDTRTVAVENGDVDHLIGTVQTDSGRTFVVDLGPTQTLKEHKLNIGAGDAISLQGNPGMFNGNSMIIADSINNKTLTFANDQDAASALDTSNGDAHERIGIRQRTISGKIQDVKEVPIQGQPQDHVMAKIETFKGHTAIVDLGPKDKVPNVTLQAGTQIAAFGTVGRLNGLPLIVAEKVAEIKDIPGREVQPQKSESAAPASNVPPPAAAPAPAPESNASEPGDNEPPASEAMEHAR